MTKLTKSQRRKRRKKGNHKKRKRAQENSLNNIWPDSRYKQVPDFFPSQSSHEERLGMLKIVAATSNAKLIPIYEAINKFFIRYNALYLLSSCSFYFFQKISNSDPELTDEMFFQFYYLEVLQAFALKQMQSFPPLEQIDLGDIKSTMHEVGRLIPYTVFDLPSASEEEMHINYILSLMRVSWSSIKNWAYVEQMEKMTLDLASKINKDFLLTYGVSSSELINGLYALYRNRNELVRGYIEKTHEFLSKSSYEDMINSFSKLFSGREATAGEVKVLWEKVGKNMQNLSSWLIALADQELQSVYSFSVDDLKQLIPSATQDKDLVGILDQLSFQFGDLADLSSVDIIEKNPVQHKPFIKLTNDTYYSSLWHILPSAMHQILENVIWARERLRNQYTKLKGEYLESEVLRIFKSSFPTAQFFPGSRYHVDGILYENDLTVIFENVAIIIEAKSGATGERARMGERGKVSEVIKNLISDPAEQALRFINLLKSSKSIHTFKTKHDPKGNVIDSSKIDYYVPLGIITSQLWLMSANIDTLISTNLLKLKREETIPIIQLTDLENVFELLDATTEKLHYLARRRQFETTIKYSGDEHDLLAFYIETGFNIGDVEFDNRYALLITGKSKELDPYFMDKKIPKPKRAIHRYWRALLTELADKRDEHWVEASYILLCAEKKEQVFFERLDNKLRRKYKKSKQVEPVINVFKFGPNQRKFAVVRCIFASSSSDVVSDIADQITKMPELEGVESFVILGIRSDNKGNIYDFMSVSSKASLIGIK
jgi:hypothetical protein